MSLALRVGTGLLVLGGLLPVSADACWLFGGCGSGPHVRHERHARRGAPQYSPLMVPQMGPMMMSPMSDCNCGSAAPMIMPEQAPMIVPQTMMRPRQTTTYVDVPRTVMRREATQVQVPTTSIEQVTLDEGSYQKVWVPRMVTRQVPRTVMQTQVQYRDVATQVTERVPRVSTEWVPEQVFYNAPRMSMGSVCEPTASYGNGLYEPQPTATPTQITPIPDYQPINPVPAPADAQRGTSQTSQIQEWQTVRQRQTIEQQSYEEYSPNYRVPKAAGRFSSPAR